MPKKEHNISATKKLKNQMILENKNQYREVNESLLAKIEDSMSYVGDVSGIVINLGDKFSPKRDIISFMNTNKVYFVGGHTRGKITNIDPMDIIIEERLETANDVGTIARGYIPFGDEKFSVRIVMWNKEREDFALVAANELKGESNVNKLFENINHDILVGAASSITELRKKMKEIKIEAPEINVVKDRFEPQEEEANEDYDTTVKNEGTPEEFDYEDEQLENDVKPSASHDDYAVFDILLKAENKKLLVKTLNRVQQKQGFGKKEDALIFIIKNFNDE